MAKRVEDSRALRCPSCGGVQHEDLGEQFFCEYCGSPLAGGVEGVPSPPTGDEFRDWREERAELPDWLEGAAGTGRVEAEAPVAGVELQPATAPTPGRQVPRRRGSTGCVPIMVIAIFTGLLCLCCGISFVILAARAELPAWLLQQEGVVFVSANERWQSTGAMVRDGDIVSIDYMAGTWTVRGGPAGERNPAGPNGYQGEYLSVGLPLTSAPVGALVGRIGNGAPFLVGRGARFRAGEGGFLKLMINDQSLGDNRGALQVKVEVTPAQ